MLSWFSGRLPPRPARRLPAGGYGYWSTRPKPATKVHATLLDSPARPRPIDRSTVAVIAHRAEWLVLDRTERDRFTRAFNRFLVRHGVVSIDSCRRFIDSIQSRPGYHPLPADLAAAGALIYQALKLAVQPSGNRPETRYATTRHHCR